MVMLCGSGGGDEEENVTTVGWRYAPRSDTPF